MRRRRRRGPAGVLLVAAALLVAGLGLPPPSWAAAAAAAAGEEEDSREAEVWEEVVALPDPARAGGVVPHRLAVLTLAVPDGLRVVREAPKGGGDLEDNVEFYPEETEHTAHGLARVECGGARPAISSDGGGGGGGALPHDYLAPLDEEHAAEVFEVAASLHGRRSGELAFAVLLRAGANRTCAAAARAEDLAGCRLVLLPPARQGVRPPGSYVDAAGARLEGSFAIRAPPGGVPRAANPERTEAAAALVLDRGCEHAARRRAEVRRMAVRGRTPVRTAAAAAAAAGAEASRPLMTVTEFMETSARGWGFDSVVGGVIGGVAEDITDATAGSMTDAMTLAAGGSLGSALEAALADVVPLTLSRTLAVAINHVLVPSLGEIVGDTVPPKVATNVQDYVVYALNDRVGGAVSKRLLTTLGATVPEDVNGVAPKKMDADEIGVLGRILVKSLTQSLVPALAHTTTHSPMADYYCYYCYHHKQYCAYCVYSPVQLYYAQYYAGYYSTYLADFYVQYFHDVVEMRFSESGAKLDRRYHQMSAGRNVDGRETEVVLEPVQPSDVESQIVR